MVVHQLLKYQFVHFLLVGGLNTAFGFSVFSALVWSGFSYMGAIALSTVAGVLFNFQTIGRLIFKDADWRRLTSFIVVYLVLYALNVLGVASLLQLGLNVYVSNAFVVGPIAVLGYLLQKRFVFERPLKSA